MGGSPPPKTFAPPLAYGVTDNHAVTAVGDPNAGNTAAGAYSTPPPTPPAPPAPAPQPITMEDLLGTDVAATARRSRSRDLLADEGPDGRRPSSLFYA